MVLTTLLLGGVTAAAATGKLADFGVNVLASLASVITERWRDRGIHALAQLARTARVEGWLPANHDLARIERKSLATAIFALHAALEAKDGTFSPDERHWVHCLHFLSSQLDAQEGSDAEAGAGAFRRWCERVRSSIADHPAMQSYGSGIHGLALEEIALASPAGSPSPLAEAVHQALQDWLTTEIREHIATRSPSTVPPPILAVWLTAPEGFEYPQPTGKWSDFICRRSVGTWVRIPFLTAWSQCYLEYLAADPLAFNKWLIQELKGHSLQPAEIKSLLATMAENEAFALAEWRKAATEQSLVLTEISQRIAEMLGLSRKSFLEIHEQQIASHGLLTALITGKLETEETLAEITETLRDIRRDLMEMHAPPCHFDPSQDTQRVEGTVPIEQIGLNELIFDRQWMPNLLFRDDEIAALVAFLDRPEPVLFSVVVGKGGVGKSRLALHLIQKARSSGWRAGFLHRRSARTVPLATPSLHEWRPAQDTLIVVDYASTHGDSLVIGLAAFLQRAAEFRGRLRILLLERPKCLDHLINPGPYEESLRKCKELVLRSLHQFQGAIGSRQTDNRYTEHEQALCLGPIHQDHWEAFIRTVFEQVDPNERERAMPAGWEVDVRNLSNGGRPLLLILVALAALRESEEDGFRAGIHELLDAFLRHEALTRWMAILREVAEESNACDTPVERMFVPLQRLIALSVLCRGIHAAPAATHAHQIRTAIGSDCTENMLNVLWIAAERILGDTLDSAESLRALAPDLMGVRFLLSGGVRKPGARSPLTALPPAPFDATSLLPVAMGIDAHGVIETFALIRFAEVSNDEDRLGPLLLSAVPHLPEQEIPENGSNNEKILAQELPKSPIRTFCLVAAHRMMPPCGGYASPLFDAMLEWSKCNLKRQHAFWLGMRVVPDGFAGVQSGSFPQVRDAAMVCLGFDLFPIFSQTQVTSPQLEQAMMELAFSIITSSLTHEGGSMPMQIGIVKWYGDWMASRYDECNDEALGMWNRALVMACVNAINWFAREQSWEGLSWWYHFIQKLVCDSRLSSSAETHSDFLRAASEAALAWSKDSSRWTRVKVAGLDILGVSSLPQWQNDKTVQTNHASAIVNFLGIYRSASHVEAATAWAGRLRTLANSDAFKSCEQIQVLLAQGGVNVMMTYGRTQHFELLLEWSDHLLELGTQPHWEAHHEIQICCARAYGFAAHALGLEERLGSREKRLGAVERWTMNLLRVSTVDGLRKIEDLQVASAQCFANTIAHYTAARPCECERVDAVVFWSNQLHSIASAPEWSKCTRIQRAFNSCAVNCIRFFGDAEELGDMRWTHIEMWGGWLRAALMNPSRTSDAGVKSEIVWAFSNAVKAYRVAERDSDLMSWLAALMTLLGLPRPNPKPVMVGPNFQVFDEPELLPNCDFVIHDLSQFANEHPHPLFDSIFGEIAFVKEWLAKLMLKFVPANPSDQQHEAPNIKGSDQGRLDEDDLNASHSPGKPVEEDNPHVIEAEWELALHELGQESFAAALPHLQKVYDARYRQFGAADRLTLECLQFLIFCLLHTGQLDQAYSHFDGVLTATQEAFGQTDKMTIQLAKIVKRLAMALDQQRDLPRAEFVLRQLLQYLSESLGAGHSDVVEIMGVLGAVVCDQGKLEEAEPLFEQVLEAANHLGSHHTHVLTALNNLGILRERRGDLSSAWNFFSRAVEGARACWPPEHPHRIAFEQSLTALERRLTTI